MPTYVLTITNIENGKFGYNVVRVFSCKDVASVTSRHLVKDQQKFWVGSCPKVLFKAADFGYDVELSHPDRDYVKVYSLRIVN